MLHAKEATVVKVRQRAGATFCQYQEINLRDYIALL